MRIVVSIVIAAVLQTAAPVVRTLDKGDRSGIDDVVHAVIRNQDEWNTLWQKHAASRPAPPVDFGRDMVVAVFLGSRPTAGYGVEIVSARDEQGALVVRFRELAPAKDAMTAQILTSPYHIVAVPRAAGAPRFVGGA